MLAAWEELDSRSASRVLGCTPAAYRLRLHRARRKLEAALREIEGKEVLIPASENRVEERC